MDYAPFGAEIPRTDDCYTSSAEVAQKFTGQELDAESALYYFGARQYAWEQGRFVSPDAPLTYSDPQNPRSWNLYSYAFNSPLLYSDPDGHDPCVNGINPITGNICTIVTAPMPDDQTDDEPDTSFFWDVYLRSLAISAVVVYQAQPLVDWLGRPRDPVCTGTYTGVGASIGFWAGGGLGTLGLAGGPTAAATIPGGAAGGAMFGGGIGGVAGLVMCSSGRWGGSGAGRGGGDHRDKTRGAQAKEQKNLNEIARKLNIDRHAFGDYVEQVKRAVGRGSSSEYGYRELVKLARQYIAEGGK